MCVGDLIGSNDDSDSGIKTNNMGKVTKISN